MIAITTELTGSSAKPSEFWRDFLAAVGNEQLSGTISSDPTISKELA